VPSFEVEFNFNTESSNTNVIVSVDDVEDKDDAIKEAKLALFEMITAFKDDDITVYDDEGEPV